VHPVDVGGRGEVAEQSGEGVTGSDLIVAERRHGEQRHPLEAAAEKPHELEGRLVSPVDVLENEHRGAFGESRPDVPKQPGTGGPGRAVDGVRQLGKGIHQRTERRWDRHVVAEAAQHPHVRTDPRCQQPYERCLADARLPAEQDETPGARVGVPHPLEQRGEERVTLYEHATILT